MAGTKKRNKNHKSLIAENRFKKTSITSLRNKPSQKKKSKLPSNSSSSSNFLIKFFKKITPLFFTNYLGADLAYKLNNIFGHNVGCKLLLFQYERVQ